MNKRERELRDKYTAIKICVDGHLPLLRIQHQAFQLCNPTTKTRAKWFCNQLAIALNRVLEQEKK